MGLGNIRYYGMTTEQIEYVEYLVRHALDTLGFEPGECPGDLMREIAQEAQEEVAKLWRDIVG